MHPVRDPHGCTLLAAPDGPTSGGGTAGEVASLLIERAEALMRVRGIEQPVPFDEPAVGYFAPPPAFVVGNEWRLIQGLRDAAMSGSAQATLSDAVVAQVREALGVAAPLAPQGLGMALADLAVTGRRNYSSFVGLTPKDGGKFETDATAKLAASGLAGVTPGRVREAAGEVLDRAYQVAW